MLKYILIFVLSFATLMADDGYLGAWGGNPVPGKSTNIEMSRELVYIKVHREYSEVFCKFWFFNHGKTEKVKVGFPDAFGESELNATSPIEKFVSIVNGKQVKVNAEFEITSLDTNDNDSDGMTNDTNSYRTWYTKEIEFAGNDTTVIEDYYIAKNSGFIDLMLMGQVFYFLGTGSTWKGAIGRGDIIFDHSEAFSNLFINENFLNDNQKLGYVWKNNYSQIVFKDLVPLKSESVSICFLNYFTGWYEGVDSDNPFNQYINYRKLTPEDLFMMKEEIEARAGIKGNEIFKDCEWYAKAQSTEIGKLSESEKTAVNDLKKQLKKFKSEINPDKLNNPCKTEQAELRKLGKWLSEFEITKFIGK